MAFDLEIAGLNHRIFILQLHRLLYRDRIDENSFEFAAVEKWARHSELSLVDQAFEVRDMLIDNILECRRFGVPALTLMGQQQRVFFQRVWRSGLVDRIGMNA